MSPTDPDRAQAGGAIRRGLSAALLLARGRREGIALFPTDAPGALHSFWAMAVSLPAFVLLRVLAWDATGLPSAPVHAMSAAVLLYAIGWVGFALLSRRVAIVLGRAGRWPHFIAAWNWCNTVQYGLFLVATAPGLLGMPAWIDQAAGLIALFWALWLEWYATRLALDIRALPAAVLVALDVLIGLLLAGSG